MAQTKIVLNTDTLFLIMGFDVSNFKMFTSDPGLFATEGEAKEWIKQNSNWNVMYGYQKVRIGSMK